MTIARTLGWIVLVMLATSGCADAPASGSAPIAIVPLNQQWTLDRIGAWGMPASIEISPGVSRRINGGSLVLHDDWTWGLAYDYRDTSATSDVQGAFAASGGYTIYGGNPVEVALHDERGGATYIAQINADDTIDLTVGSYTFHLVTK